MESTYKINLEGEWTLEDWYLLPHAYGQVYAFIYSLKEIKKHSDSINDDTSFDERILFTYTSQPWLGGYSAVNFYNYLQNLIPPKHRPRIKAIHYESPGFMELILVVPVAIAIKELIQSFCTAGKSIHSLYNEIYKGMQERKLLQIDVKKRELELKEADFKFVNSAIESLGKLLGFKNIEDLHRVTKNPVTSLKILLSFYRRIRFLAGYVNKAKAKF